MMFQRFLRGISDANGQFDDAWMLRTLEHDGLRSAWLRRAVDLDPGLWSSAITDEALRWHVSKFDSVIEPVRTRQIRLGGLVVGPRGRAVELLTSPPEPPVRFRERTPFISVTAGTVEPERARDPKRNVPLPAWLTASGFATDWGNHSGWVVYGYVSLLGRPSLPLMEFSEEVRDLHQHEWFNRHHSEGEILAKIWIPPVRLEGAVRVNPDNYNGLDDLARRPPGERPQDPLRSIGPFLNNPRYRDPAEFVNLRNAL